MSERRRHLSAEASAFLAARFGTVTGVPLTLEELANIMGTTREHVRVLERRFLREAQEIATS